MTTRITQLAMELALAQRNVADAHAEFAIARTNVDVSEEALGASQEAFDDEVHRIQEEANASLEQSGA